MTQENPKNEKDEVLVNGELVSVEELKEKDEDVASFIKEIPAQDYVSDEYIIFTMYTITDRAITGVDGLKPVNKRILQNMYKKGIRYNKPHIKGGTIAANVMGELHPHGNSSIEDAISRMAQWHYRRVPLIDPHGNIGGAFVGAEPAAARYWTARLSQAGEELVKEIDDGAVDLSANFEGKMTEYRELPVRWPVAVINGSDGIAVGYKALLIPHNPDEVMKACIELVKNPNMTLDRLIKIMPGPDFPTGGQLDGVDGIRSYYKNGTGKVILKGKYRTEAISRGRTKITFYEHPYGVSHRSVVFNLREMMEAGKLPGVASVEDNAGKQTGSEVVITTKSGVNYKEVVNAIYAGTNEKKSISVNNVILNDKIKPYTASMFDMLNTFIGIREKVNRRILNNRTVKLKKKISNLEAIIAVLSNLDKAISIIRESEDLQSANSKLVKEFSITEDQASYILGMALRRLTKSDAQATIDESNSLKEELLEVEEILSDPDKFKAHLIEDLKKTQKIISSPRRTDISGLTEEEVKEAERAIMKQAKASKGTGVEITYTMMEDGTIKKTEGSEPFSYPDNVKRLTSGSVVSSSSATTVDDMLLLSSDGVARKIPASYFANKDELTLKDLATELPSGIQSMALAPVSADSETLAFISTRDGEVKLSKLDGSQSKAEFPICPLDKDILSIQTVPKDSKDNYTVFMGSSNGKVLGFPLSSLNEKGSLAGLVSGFNKGSENDSTVMATIVENSKIPTTSLASISETGVKITPLSDVPVKGRGGAGVYVHRPAAGGRISSMIVGTDLSFFNKSKELNVEPSFRAAKETKTTVKDVKVGVKML